MSTLSITPITKKLMATYTANGSTDANGNGHANGQGNGNPLIQNLPLDVLQLDPVERAVVIIGDERDAVQKKTFTKWVNQHLNKVGQQLHDLVDDVRDGNNLITLLEVLTGQFFERERGRTTIHRIQNVQRVLEFLRKVKHIKIVNLRPEDIVEGNQKLILGLIWTIILHFQISEGSPGGPETTAETARDTLFTWCKRMTEGYPGVRIRDFTSSFRDALSFLAIIHRIRPDLVDYKVVKRQNNQQNLELAFNLAEQYLGVPKLLDPEDFAGADLDDKSVMTYLSALHHVFPNPPSMDQLNRDRERKQAYEEYVELAGGLVAWLLQSISSSLVASPLPAGFVDLKRLQSDLARFRISELPARQAVRQRLTEFRATLDQYEPLDDGLFPIADDIKMPAIMNQWDTLMSLLQARELSVAQALHSHDAYKELTDRLRRDFRKVEETITDADRKLYEYERASPIAPGVQEDLVQQVETTASSVRQAGEKLAHSISELKEMRENLPANADQAAVEQLQNKACQLNSTCLNLATRLSDVHTKLAGDKPGSRKLFPWNQQQQQNGSSSSSGGTLRPIPGGKVVNEGLLTTVQPLTQDQLRDSLEWVRKRKVQVDKLTFGSEYDVLKRQLAEHQKLHQEIVQYASKVTPHALDQPQLQQAYDSLVQSSAAHLKSLQGLCDLLAALTMQLRWLAEQHDAEANRDWTNSTANLSMFEKRYESLMAELETRQPLWYDLVKQALALADHPAHLLIETYTAALERESSAFLQLIVAFEAHLEDARRMKLYQTEVMEAEKFLHTKNEQLSGKDQTSEKASDVKSEIEQFAVNKLSKLRTISSQLRPLFAADCQTQPPKNVEAICAYRSGSNQSNPALVQNATYRLAQLSADGKKSQWKVAPLTAGPEFVVPAVCFVLPAPSKSALDRLAALETRYQSVTKSAATTLKTLRKRALNDKIKQIKAAAASNSLSPEQLRALVASAEADLAALQAESGSAEQPLSSSIRQSELEQFKKDLAEASVSLTSSDLNKSIENLRANIARAEQAANFAAPPGETKENQQRRFAAMEQEAANLEQDIAQLSAKLAQAGQHMNPAQRRALEMSLGEAKNRLKALQAKVQAEKSAADPKVVALESARRLAEASREIDQKMGEASFSLPSDLSQLGKLSKDLEALSKNAGNLRGDVSAVTEAKTNDEILAQFKDAHDEVERRREVVRRGADALSQFRSVAGERARIGDALKLQMTNMNAGKMTAAQLNDMQSAVAAHCKAVEKLNGLAKQVATAGDQYSNLVSDYNAKKGRGKQNGLPKPNAFSSSVDEETVRLNEEALKLLESFTKRVQSGDIPPSEQKKFADAIELLRKDMKESLDESGVRGSKSAAIEEQLAAALATTVAQAVDRMEREKAATQGLDIILPGSESRLLDCPAFRHPGTKQTMSLKDALQQGLIDLQNGTVLNPATGERVPLAVAISHGLIDPALAERLKSSSGIVDESGVELSLLEAIQSGVIDVERETIVIGDQMIPLAEAARLYPDLITPKLLALVEGAAPDASSQNAISVISENEVVFGKTDEPLPAMSLGDAIRLGYVTQDGSIIDPQTGEVLSLLDAIKSGVISGHVKDIIVPRQDGQPGFERLSLAEALERGFVDPSTGDLLIGGQRVALVDAQQHGLVAEPLKLFDAVAQGLLTADGKITDPITGERLTIAEAIERGYLDGDEKCLRDPRTNQPISLKEAVAEGLVDPETFTLSVAPENDPNAKPVNTSLLEAIHSGVLTVQKEDVEFTSRNIVDPSTGRMLTLHEACQLGVIDLASGHYVNPETGESISLAEAEKQGLIPAGLEASLASDTEFVDPSTGQRWTLGDLIANGLFDPETGNITNPNTGEQMSIAEAQNAGLLQPEQADSLAKLFGAMSIKRLILDTSSMVSPGAGGAESTSGSGTGPIDSGVASVPTDSSGVSPKASPPIKDGANSNVKEAQSANDSESHRRASIRGGTEALLLCAVVNPETGEQLSIAEAERRGLIDLKRGTLRNPVTGEVMSIDAAIAEGLVITNGDNRQLDTSGRDLDIVAVFDPKTNTFIPVEEAVQRGLFNPETKEFTDPSTGRVMALDEAIANGFLKAEPASGEDLAILSVYDANTDSFIPLEKAIELSIFDLSANTFRNPISGVTLSINDAIDAGLIQTGKPVVYCVKGEPVKADDIIVESVTDPNTGEEISAATAIARGILDRDLTTFRNPDTGETMTLAEALAHGLLRARRVSDVSSTDSNHELNVPPANFGPGGRRTSQVSDTGSTLCELEFAIDTRTGLPLDISDAINQGILDENLTTFTDLSTGESMPIAVAIERGFLKAVPVSTNENGFPPSVPSDHDGHDDHHSNDSMRFVLESVRDPETGALISVDEAIERGLLSQDLDVYRLPDGTEIPLVEAMKLGYVQAELLPSEGVEEEIKKGQENGHYTNGEMPLSNKPPTIITSPSGKLRSGSSGSNREEDVDDLVDRLITGMRAQTAWLNEQERVLGGQEPIFNGDEDALREAMQLNQSIADEINSRHASVISPLLNQCQSFLISRRGHVTDAQFSELEANHEQLSKKTTNVGREASDRAKTLSNLSLEFTRYAAEAGRLSLWLASTESRLGAAKDVRLDDMKSVNENLKALQQEALAKDADFKYLSATAQRLLKDVRKYNKGLEKYSHDTLRSQSKTFDPAHLEAAEFKESHRQVIEAYSELMSKLSAIIQSSSAALSRLSAFESEKSLVERSLADAEKQAAALTRQTAGQLGADQMREQAARLRNFGSDIAGSWHDVDKLKQAADELIGAVEQLQGGLSIDPNEMVSVQNASADASNRLAAVQDSVAQRSQTLDAAILQTQGLDEQIQSVTSWLLDTKGKADQFSIPSAADKLAPALEQFRIMKSEFDTRQPDVQKLLQTIDQTVQKAGKNVDTTGLEGKARQVSSLNDEVDKKVSSLSSDLEAAERGLNDFETAVVAFKDWLNDARKLNAQQPQGEPKSDEAKRQLLDKLKREKEEKEAELERIKTISSDLLSMQGGLLADPSSIKQKVSELEQSWQQAAVAIDENDQKQAQIDETSQEYAKISGNFQKWLGETEQKLEIMPPVSFDLEQLERVSDEVCALMGEWEEQQAALDDLIDVGTTLDSLSNGEQPLNSRNRFNKMRRIRSASRLASSKSNGSLYLTADHGASRSNIHGSNDSMNSAFDETGSVVEQDLRNSNFRFAALKDRLADRRAEVAALADGIRSFKRDNGAISDWLSSREAEISSPVLPKSPADAQRMLQQEGDNAEDIVGRLHEFASVQRRMDELLRSSPAPATGDASRDAIVAEMRANERRMAEVRQAAGAKRANLQGLLDDDKRFHDLHRSLMSWLQQKEKMLLVIGPVTAEPTLVRSQLQQLELLADELGASRHEAEQLKQLAAALRQQCDPTSDYNKQIEQEADAVSNKWAAVDSRLAEKHALLKKLLEKSVGFYQRLQGVSDWASSAQSKLEDLAASGVTAAPESEETLASLDAELNERENALAALRQECDQLYEDVGEPAASFDLKNKLASAERPISDVKRKVSNLRQEVQRANAQTAKTKDQIKQLSSWLVDLQGRLAAVSPLSGLEEVLDQQILSIQSIHEELNAREDEIRRAVKQAGKFDENSAQDVRQQAAKLRTDFSTLNTAVQEKLGKRRAVLRQVQKFSSNASSLQTWLSSLERSSLSNRALPIKKDQINQLKREVKAVQNELLRRSHEFDTFSQLGTDILAEIQTDSEHIERVMAEIKERWLRLNADAQSESQRIDDYQHELAEILDQIQDVTNNLAKCEDRYVAMEAAAVDGKNADKLRSVQGDVIPLSNSAEKLAQAVANFVAEFPVENPDQLIEEASALKQRCDDMNRSLTDLLDNIDLQTGILSNFEQVLTSFNSNLAEAQSELDHIGPVARDMDALQTQFEEIRNFVQNLEGLDVVAEAERRGKELVEDGYMSPDSQLTGQLSSLRRQWDQLMAAAADRERRVLETMGQVQQFQELVTDCQNGISAAGVEFRSLKPPAGDVSNIQKLQDDYQTFHRDTCEPMDARVAAAVRLGRELAASADRSVDVSGLQSDLDLVQDKWSDLKSKFGDYQQRLNQALVKSGQFREALTSLCQWLTETEKLTSSQKSPSVDYNLIRAQMQEQKLIHHMLTERAPTVEQMSRMAEQLSAQAERGDREKILEEMGSALSRWQALNSAANQRQLALEHIYDEAKIFHDRHKPLSDWLDRISSDIEAMKPMALSPVKLKENVAKYQALLAEMEHRALETQDLADRGRALAARAPGEDADILAERCDVMSDRFASVRGRINEGLAQCQQALTPAQAFTDSFTALSQWFDQVEPMMQQVDDLEEQAVDELLKSLPRQEAQLNQLVQSSQPLLALCQGVEQSEAIKRAVDTANKRLNLTSAQLKRRLDKIRSAKNQVDLIFSDIDELVTWFEDVNDRLGNWVHLQSCDVPTLRQEMSEHRGLADEIQGQKAHLREIASRVKHIAADLPGDVDQDLAQRLQNARDLCQSVSKRNGDLLSTLDQSIPQAEAFTELHDELSSWLNDIEYELADLDTQPAAVTPERIRKQQLAVEALRRQITDARPKVDRLVKAGSVLAGLASPQVAEGIRSVSDEIRSRVDALRQRLQQRSADLTTTMDATAQVSEKLDAVMAVLTRACDRVESAEPISAQPDRLRDQIAANRQLVGDLERQLDTLTAVRQAAEALLSQAPASATEDPAVLELRSKVDRLVNQYDKLREITAARTDTLDEALDVSQRFWTQLGVCQEAIREIEEELQQHSQPGLELNELEEQQQMMNEVADHLLATRAELENVGNDGTRLADLVGAPDRPVVQRNVEDIAQHFDSLVSQYEASQKKIEAAYERTHDFNSRVALVLDQLKICEDQFELMGHIPGEIEAVKAQVAQVKDFKEGVMSLKPNIDELRKLGEQLLTASGLNPGEERALSITDPLQQVQTRWERLLANGARRSAELELALLQMGYFKEAVAELTVWLDETEKQLDEAPAVLGDATAAEIEMTKLQLLQSDLDQHRDAMDNVQDAAKRIIASKAGTTADEMRRVLDEIDEKWKRLLTKARDRQIYLEGAIRIASNFHEELDALLEQLSQVDSLVATSRPIGGTPESANHQLTEFLALQNELAPLMERAQKLQEAGTQLLQTATDTAQEILKYQLEQLEKRCANIKDKSSSRRKQLEDAVQQAIDFDNKHEAFTAWLSDAERQVAVNNQQQPIARALTTLSAQQDDHKRLLSSLQDQTQKLNELDAAGTHLQYFAIKADAVQIKNMLLSVQHRWDKLRSRVADRTAQLDFAMRDAKQFYQDQKELCEYLDGVKEKMTQEPAASPDEPDRIRALLAKQRDFTRQLDAKQPVYDALIRQGATLLERATEGDRLELQSLITGVKERWIEARTNCLERQQKLEDALLLSGQFREALQALLDWVGRTEPLLSDETSVRGDSDTVGRLLDEQNLFESEFAKRAAMVEQVKKQSVQVLQQSQPVDGPRLQSELADLEATWANISKLSEQRNARLADAKQTADKFAALNRGLLDWLSSAENRVRAQGPIPLGDRGELVIQQADVRDLLELAETKQNDLSEAMAVGRSILEQCHPDAIVPVRHWMTVLQSRWDEVVPGVLTRRLQQLDEALSQLIMAEQLLSELLAWLTGAEATLKALNEQPIPSDVQVIQQLLKEHEDFESEMNSRKTDVDRVTKNQRRLNNITETETPASPAAKSNLRQPTKSQKPASGGSLSVSNTMPNLNMPNEPRFADPQVDNMYATWRRVWLLVVDRRRRLMEAKADCEEMELLKHFNFDDWRRRYLGWMNHNKTRIMDLFRQQDKDRDGKLTREEFIEGIIQSKFPTSRREMECVADIFDSDGDNYIDLNEFVRALKPDTHHNHPRGEEDQIAEEMNRQVAKCMCQQRYRIEKVDEQKYRFGKDQKMCLVRILSSTVMVRVGGGWVALDEFLVKNDPCRAKGRTNFELRERFLLPDGASQAMAPFVSRSLTTRPPSAGPSTSPHGHDHHGHVHTTLPARTPTTPRATTPSSVKPQIKVKNGSLAPPKAGAANGTTPTKRGAAATSRTPGAQTPKSIGSRTPQVRSGHGSVADLTAPAPRVRKPSTTSNGNQH